MWSFNVKIQDTYYGRISSRFDLILSEDGDIYLAQCDKASEHDHASASERLYNLALSLANHPVYHFYCFYNNKLSGFYSPSTV